MRFEGIVPDMRSIHELTLIFSLVFIIFNASSNSTSPVRVSSITSIMRSASGKRRLPESFCILILPLKANSMTIHPLSAYDMLSFQKERYPYLRRSAIASCPSALCCLPGTHLFILQPQQQHLLHHRQLRLLTSFCALVHIPRIKRNLMSILAALIACLWLAAALWSWCWRLHTAAVALVSISVAWASGSSAARQS